MLRRGAAGSNTSAHVHILTDRSISSAKLVTCVVASLARAPKRRRLNRIASLRKVSVHNIDSQIQGYHM